MEADNEKNDNDKMCVSLLLQVSQDVEFMLVVLVWLDGHFLFIYIVMSS